MPDSRRGGRADGMAAPDASEDGMAAILAPRVPAIRPGRTLAYRSSARAAPSERVKALEVPGGGGRGRRRGRHGYEGGGQLRARSGRGPRAVVGSRAAGRLGDPRHDRRGAGGLRRGRGGPARPAGRVLAAGALPAPRGRAPPAPARRARPPPGGRPPGPPPPPPPAR